MADEDDYWDLDLAVAYSYFFRNGESTKKREQRQKHERPFYVSYGLADNTN